jgi:hypothetical protein
VKQKAEHILLFPGPLILDGNQSLQSDWLPPQHCCRSIRRVVARLQFRKLRQELATRASEAAQTYATSSILVGNPAKTVFLRQPTPSVWIDKRPRMIVGLRSRFLDLRSIGSKCFSCEEGTPKTVILHKTDNVYECFRF